MIFNRPAGVAEALLEKVPRDVKILILSRLSIPDLLRYKFVNARAFYEAQMILAKKAKEVYGCADPYVWSVVNGFKIRGEEELSESNVKRCLYLKCEHLEGLPYRFEEWMDERFYNVEDVIKRALQQHGSVKKIVSLGKEVRFSDSRSRSRLRIAKLWSSALKSIRTVTQSVFGGFREYVENYVRDRCSLEDMTTRIQNILNSIENGKMRYQCLEQEPHFRRIKFTIAHCDVKRFQLACKPLGFSDEDSDKMSFIYVIMTSKDMSGRVIIDALESDNRKIKAQINEVRFAKKLKTRKTERVKRGRDEE